MNIVVWIALCAMIGGIVGWIVSIAVPANGTLRVPLNILVGALGAVLGGWLLSAEFGSSLVNRGGIPLSGIGASSFGAMLLVSVATYFWRDRRT